MHKGHFLPPAPMDAGQIFALNLKLGELFLLVSHAFEVFLIQITEISSSNNNN